jgi:hypothetical protein
MNKELLSFLDSELPTIANKIEYINHGGCGIFAYYLSMELTKHDIKHDILWLGELDDELDSDELLEYFYETLELVEDAPYLTHFHNRYFDMNHLVIELDGHFIDCEGVFSDTFYFQCGRELGNITQRQLKSFIKNDGWNDVYDQTNNTKMHYHIKKVFKKFGNIK